MVIIRRGHEKEDMERRREIRQDYSDESRINRLAREGAKCSNCDGRGYHIRQGPLRNYEVQCGVCRGDGYR